MPGGGYYFFNSLYASIPTGAGESSAPSGDSASYTPALGNLWTAVKLHYGQNKEYAFEVLGRNDTAFGDAEVTVRYPDGTEAWKSSDAITQNSIYWVRADDPAVKTQAWDMCSQ